MNDQPAYFTEYENIRMNREGGILEINLHTDGGPLVWSGTAHRDFPAAFADISNDSENRVVLLTGAGDTFCVDVATSGWGDDLNTTLGRDRIYREGRKLIKNLMGIEVPIVAAVNGPAHMHAELALLSDIVICSQNASFRDPHFVHGSVPGDGVHIVWPILLGVNRARYFQYTGQVISAQEALALGIVGEVVESDQLLRRARELAQQLALASPLQLRYSRTALTIQIDRMLEPDLGYGLMLEMFGALDDVGSGRPRITNAQHPMSVHG